MPSQEVLAKVFKELSKKAKPLFRRDKDLEKILSEGFNEERQLSRLPGWNEPDGLYLATKPSDLTTLIEGRRNSFPTQPNITALPLEGSKKISFSPNQWNKLYEGKSSVDITKDLKNKADFVEFHDPNSMNSYYTRQVVQLNPNKSIAKIKTDKGSIYKILGLTGAGAGLSLFNQQEADAMPIGKFFPKGSAEAIRALKGPASSTAKDLKGVILKGATLENQPDFGKAIFKITKENADWRNIIYKDGSIRRVTKDELANMEKILGTAKQEQVFLPKSVEGQKAQAEKSLNYHQARSTYGTAKSKAQDISLRKNQFRNLVGGEVPTDMVMVRVPGSKVPINLPRHNAELLERDGLVKILKTPIK